MLTFNGLQEIMKYINVKMTEKQAEALGIIKCAHCKYPQNNHFDFDEKKCAHDNTCPGWKASVVLPKMNNKKLSL